MRNTFKKLSALKGKKRYIVFGFIAVEMLSLPAAAQIVHRVAFDIRPVVIAVEIPTADTGVSRFLVTSNAGFGVKASDAIGNIKTDVYVSGTMGELSRFGESAQLPGPKAACAQTSGQSSDIYIANRKTAATPGTPPEQAVVFEFRYEANTRPNFEFIAGSDSAATPKSCLNATS